MTAPTPSADQTVDIDLGACAYQVRIGRDLLRADEIAPWIGGAQICIITDDCVAPLYLEKVRDSLRDALGDVLSGKVIEIILPHGEQIKTLNGVARVFDAMLAARCERETTVLALGGGVVGDIAGFAAACYQRGVAFIQLPTTLLAQVDSSVGGKTGVNHARGKNMIGAFYQPRRVIADTATLDTLDRRQFAAGMAEVIKYGIIDDADFFAWLEANIEAVMARKPDALAHIIAQSCTSKAKIVARDERESGVRALLNLGHTFAHAIEAGAGYGQWLHGEAVATGIAMAAYLARGIGKLSGDDEQRIVRLLSAAELPVSPFAGLAADKMLALMKGDKKVRAGKVRLILPNGIGNCEIVDDYPPKLLTDTVAHFTAASS